jgi:glycosyltransferase involved in cell wall biosynthesis
MSNSRVWVVLPAYNEAETLTLVVSRVRLTGYSVVCVDDGSSDATASIAKRLDCDVVVHPFNLGQGAAIQTGIDYALERGADFICTLDADGQHDADELPRLIRALEEHRADFALGNRFLGNAIDMPPMRRALIMAATIFTRLTTRLRITDTHNGMRAMTRRGATLIQLRQDRMAHASEMLMQIRKGRLPMVEVPVTVTYTAYSLRKGQRSLSAFRVLADLAAGLLRP